MSSGPARPFDHLLLDFGGPCLVSPVELHPFVEAHFDLAPGTLDWMGPIAPESDELYRRSTGEGDITEREYWELRAQEVGRLAGVTLDTRAYMKVAFDNPEERLIRPGAMAVRQAAGGAGVTVSVLTNDLRAFHSDAWVERITFLTGLDHLIDLSHTGVLKPDPAAYRLALDTVGATDPARVLFVDDQPLNVAGARSVGLRAAWFDIRDPGGSWQAVGDLLGLDAVPGLAVPS